MALKADRHEFYTTTRYFCNDVVDRGVVLVYSGSGGSGYVPDDTASVVYLLGTGANAASGAKPAGLLMNDVVNVDESYFHINFHKDETRVGSKVRLLKKGWVWTDQVVGTPVAGGTAYLTVSGKVKTTQDTSAPAVGAFASQIDSDGFVLLEVDIV